MALLPANPGEALWIGGAAGQNHANVGIGQGTSGGQNHEDFSQAQIEDGYTDADKFFLNAEGNAVFRINAGAGRTSTNTAHPRSECREYNLNGTTKSAWDGRSGDHYLKARVRIIDVTSNRPWVCFGQIHGSEGSPEPSDLVRLQSEGDTGATTGLSLVCRRSPPAGGGEIRTVLLTGYNVGDWFDYEIRMTAGRLIIKINGQTKLDATGMGQILNYFKWGCYLQDNTEKGASASDWAAVEFERGSLQVWHTGYPAPSTPVFTGATDPEGGPGGGDGTADIAPPTVPTNGRAVRGNTQLSLSWTASTDNVGVTQYNVYKYAADTGGGAGGVEFEVGKTDSGSSTTASSADKIIASRHVASASGTLTEGRFRGWLSASGSTNSKMLVYSDDGGDIDELLAESDQISIATTSEGIREYLFTGADQIDIDEDVAYWVAVAWDDPGSPSVTFSRGGTTGGRVESTATYGTPPDPFGTISGTLTGPIDAWLIATTGTPGGGGSSTTSFGKQTDGASNSASSTDKMAVSLFAATATGTLTAGHARAWMSATGSTSTRMVVVSDVAGVPTTVLAVSDALTVSATTEGLRDYTFSGGNQITIASGTSYWLGLAWDDPGTPSLTLSRDGTSGLRIETSAHTFPPTQGGAFGTPAAAQAGPIDVYVDVSSSSSGSGYVLDGTTATTSYTDTGLTNGTEYQYVVTAEDAAGNESAQSDPFTGTPGPPDTTAPTVPSNVNATAGDRRVTITWDASTDADGEVLQYTVYTDGAQPRIVPANDTTARALVIVGLTNGVTYSFTVSATDDSLNESAPSSADTATPAAPSIAGATLLPQSLVGGKVEVAVAWGADLTADESTWTWTDITDDVRQDPGISTALGRNDESSTSNPATMTCVLDNTGHAYSLGGRSPNWPNVRRNVPVRVRVDPGDGGGGRVVFQGGADGFTPGWADSPRAQVPIVTLSASGTLRRLTQGSAPVQGVYRRAMLARTAVKAYWPLEEGQSATYGAVARGGSDFVVTGSPDWAADSSFFCSAPLPNLSGGYLNATVDAYTDTNANQVRWLMAFPDDGLPDGTVIAHISTTGSIHRFDLTYEIGTDGVHSIGLYVYRASDGAQVGVAVYTTFGAAFLGGFTGRASLELVDSGGNIAWRFGLVPAAYGSSELFGSGTVSSHTAGIVDQLEFNPHSAQAGLVVGHVTVENAISSAFSDSFELGAYEGEFSTSVAGRLVRLCTENSIPLQRYTSASQVGSLDKMGPQLAKSLVDLMHECEAADQGQLWDGRSAGLQYTTRRRRELGTLTLTLDASAGELTIAPTDDDQRTRNRVQVTRLHGITVTKEDATGPLGTGPDGIGIYDDSITINNRNDSMAHQYAHWFVALGTVEGYRYPSVTVNLAANPALAGDVLDVIPGDRIDVTGLDDTLASFPDDTVSLIVEGIAHEISTFSWMATFRCSLFEPWAVGEVAAESGAAAFTVSYPFTSGSVGATNSGAAVTGGVVTASNVTVAAVTAGYASDPVLAITDMASTTAAAAIAAGEYITLTLTPAVDVTSWSVTSLTFDAARGGSSTPRGLVVRGSHDGYAATLAGGGDLATENPTLATRTITVTALTGLTGPLTLRIYGYAPSTGAYIDIDTIAIAGTYLSSASVAADMVMRLDTDGSTVNTTAAAGATSLSVASSGEVWTTDADDYPLYLSVGGVKVRATACSGGSSPQTMTVDALPVARAAGLPIKLWQPRRIGLG